MDTKKGPRAHSCWGYPLDSIFFSQFILHFAYYILYLLTFFKETYIIVVRQVKEGVVPQKGPTAHNSWSYVPWYAFQLMYFAMSEKFLISQEDSAIVGL